MRLGWLKEVPFALLGWLNFRLSSIKNFREQLNVKIYSNYPALPYWNSGGRPPLIFRLRGTRAPPPPAFDAHACSRGYACRPVDTTVSGLNDGVDIYIWYGQNWRLLGTYMFVCNILRPVFFRLCTGCSISSATNSNAIRYLYRVLQKHST